MANRRRARTVGETSIDEPFHSYGKAENEYFIDRSFASIGAQQQDYAPQIPPRNPPTPTPRSRPDLHKAASIATTPQQIDEDEELYISANDIDSFPTRPAPVPTPLRCRPATVRETRKDYSIQQRTKRGERHEPQSSMRPINANSRAVEGRPSSPLPALPQSPLESGDMYSVIVKNNKNLPVPGPRSPRDTPRSSQYFPDVPIDNRVTNDYTSRENNRATNDYVSRENNRATNEYASRENNRAANDYVSRHPVERDTARATNEYMRHPGESEVVVGGGGDGIIRAINSSPESFRHYAHGTSGDSSGAQPVSNETAIYGMAQGRTSNLVMEFKKIQSRLTKLYQKIEANSDPTQIYELKVHLRVPEHSNADTLIRQVHKSLTPSTFSDQEGTVGQESLYVVDFHEFQNKFTLRQQLINMFAKPGPPSISYQKVDAKMDNIITEFCQRTEELRSYRNELVLSPAHARSLMQGIQDAESLVKALRDNELWIRWGTPSFLPPLAHLYMNKHPPFYEVRKAVTLSFIAERRRSTPDMFRSILNPESLCPPIYSRLRTSNSNDVKWQVTEYNETSGKFDNRECQLPSWLEQDALAWHVLHSSNRSLFENGKHPYALYTVYLVIVKDFTLGQDNEPRGERDSYATPSKYQYYVNSSSTGVLYRFTHIANSHCERIYQVLQEAPTLKHFRCYDGCDLVEACLALSWLRRQPRAVFVLNSFLATSMSSLSLERKKPFHDKMKTLERHLAEGKKLGPLFDMRYGMNGTTTVTEELE